MSIKIRRITKIIRSGNILDLLAEVIAGIRGTKSCIADFDNKIGVFFEDKKGLEIGGQSGIFSDRSLLPIYKIVSTLDNCNFSETTIWQRYNREGLTFNYHKNKPKGYQYIYDATNLEKINTNSYDFVLASHVIEHLANPLKALFEWKRILRNNGVLFLVCPHKENTFDHKRPITPLSHLIEDFEKDTDEHDLTHLPEILELHDLKMNPRAGSYDKFVARSKNNYENRCLHHHVFLTESLINIFDYINLEIVYLRAELPYHIIIIGKKSDNLHIHKNKQFLAEDTEWRKTSPFHIDKSPL